MFRNSGDLSLRHYYADASQWPAPGGGGLQSISVPLTGDMCECATPIKISVGLRPAALQQ